MDGFNAERAAAAERPSPRSFDYAPAVASLEEHAIRRDRKFLVRLVLALGAGLVFGLFLFNHLTSNSVVSCAAQSFGDAAPAAAP
jgi:hypothetical protein